MIILKSRNELEKMWKAGQVVAQVHEWLREALRPGITTRQLDELAETKLRELGAIPSFLGYGGFPGSACISVNEEVVHGIPGDRVLEEGDIVSIDVGGIVDGYHGDAARTWPVGEVSEEAQRLIADTEAALELAIEQARIGNRLSDIGAAVQTYAEARGYGVVRDFVGHGIGRSMHEAPQIPNYGLPGRGPRLKAGMTLAIEPMLNLGTHKVRVLENKWTVVTEDGALSAHYEDTVAITVDGPWILTRLKS
ncbi:MAG: type I methionyl aminopeptidase [Firmicutes bacterium]|nr:type I methionyl aminopeptidase [Bacillota bacterium]